MRILFDHSSPFRLAHGGFQTQIEQTRIGLEAVGIEVEFTRWWDEDQTGDLIHFFGAAPVPYLEAARAKRIPVVMTNLFTATCNRSDSQLHRQGVVTRTILGLPFGGGIKRQLSWPSFALCTRNVVGLAAERRVLELVYGLPPDRVSIVPLGLPADFIDAGHGGREKDHLVCVGTITERKNSVILARHALTAGVPILFVGKPYSEADPYWLEFKALIDGRVVRHQPHVHDVAEMIRLLHASRGAVVMSWYENWCLAAHEAAACGLPLLLPPQNWARECFGSEAHYFEPGREAASLKAFHEEAARLPAPNVRLYRWTEVAEQLRGVYDEVLKTSR